MDHWEVRDDLISRENDLDLEDLVERRILTSRDSIEEAVLTSGDAAHGVRGLEVPASLSALVELFARERSGWAHILASDSCWAEGGLNNEWLILEDDVSARVVVSIWAGLRGGSQGRVRWVAARITEGVDDVSGGAK